MAKAALSLDVPGMKSGPGLAGTKEFAVFEANLQGKNLHVFTIQRHAVRGIDRSKKVLTDIASTHFNSVDYMAN